MYKPTKRYIQDLMIDTVKAVTHLDPAVHIAVSYKEISQTKHNKHFTQKTIKYNKQIRRKLIKIIITKTDKGIAVVVIDKYVYQ
jgi:hypothetical protein